MSLVSNKTDSGSYQQQHFIFINVCKESYFRLYFLLHVPNTFYEAMLDE